MNFISFTKYKSYLESIGYSLERGKDDYSDSLRFITYFFSKEGEKDKYFVNVFTKSVEERLLPLGSSMNSTIH